MLKFMWVDTETSGLDPVLQDIIQVAGKIVIGNEVKDEFNFICQPFSFDNISEQALKVNGRTVEELQTFPLPGTVYRKVKGILDKHIDAYDRNDKLIPCGQQIRFDMDFMSEFFKKNGDNYFFSYVQAAPLDTMTMAVMLEVKLGEKIFKNYKLETLCSVLGIKLDTAHDALHDIDATRRVAAEIYRRINYNSVEV